MEQPVPVVVEADVARVVRREFSSRDVELAEALLDEVTGPEALRVRLAVLRLANGDVEQLRHYVQCARTDFRDVLMWAEYDAMSRLACSASESERVAAIQRDWAEYQEWLGRA